MLLEESQIATKFAFETARYRLARVQQAANRQEETAELDRFACSKRLPKHSRQRYWSSDVSGIGRAACRGTGEITPQKLRELPVWNQRIRENKRVRAFNRPENARQALPFGSYEEKHEALGCYCFACARYVCIGCRRGSR